MRSTKKGFFSNVKKREDRTSSLRQAFEPLLVETKNINTVMLMLQSPEDSIVAQALAALDKFAMKTPDNTQFLMAFDIPAMLSPLLKHSELSVRRYATKLLAELCTQDVIRKNILADVSQIPYFVQMLRKETDIPLQEFSAAILAELAEQYTALPQIRDTNIIDILFTRIKSSDPDVQFNSAKILMSMLNDPEGRFEVVGHSSFDFKPILSLLQSDYPVIQNKAIDILINVTSLRDKEDLQKAFRECNGLDQLMDLLEMFDWKDLHSGVLSILSNVADNPFTAPYVNTSGYARRLLQYAEDIHDPELTEAVLDVITKMANSESGRRVLMESNIVDILLRYLRDEQARIKRAACIAIGSIIQNPQALEILMKENPLREVLNILKNEQESWETRHGAAVALCNILDSDRYFCDLFLNLRQQDVLLHIMKQPSGKVPVEMLITLLQCLGVLAIHENTRSRMIDSDITNAILPHFESQEAQLRIAACICLSAYACEQQVRENFLHGQGVAKLTNCLKHNLMPVRQAAACLLQLLACDKKIAASFISAGVLFWMLKQKYTLNICPAWETGIATLFKSCLPAKFAHMNALDLQDNTGDIFYVMRKPGKQFIVLDEMFTICAVPLHVVYVVNFSDKSSTDHLNKGRKSKCRKKTTDAKEETDGEIESYSRFVFDQYLYETLQQFKNLLKDEEEGSARPSINHQASLLARFVASKMCGIAKGNICTNHICNLHVTELKRELGTTIIPLGYVRVGMHFERALLFKALADQVGLLCSLVRGDFGRTWVEIASPQSDPPEEEHALQVEDLPMRLLKTNCVVDLVDEPGRLLPIGSYEAAAYCAYPSAEE